MALSKRTPLAIALLKELLFTLLTSVASAERGDRSAGDFTGRQDPDVCPVSSNTQACQGRKSRYNPRLRKSLPSRS